MYTSILPAERRYTLFEGSNVKLYYRQEKARRCVLRALLHMRLFASAPYGRINDAGARLLHPVDRLHLWTGATVSGCLCGAAWLPAAIVSDGLPAASGQAVHGQQVSRSGVPSKGGSSLPSARALSSVLRPSAQES